MPLAWAATGGPDSFGFVFIDSNESDGPPHVALDIDDEGYDLGLGDEDTAVLDLPFKVSWYGSKETTAYVGDNATLFFAGEQSSGKAACPPSGSWSGVAAYWDDLTGATVRHATLGQYPYRLVVVDWQDFSPGSASGTGHVQVWLQEGRDEVVVIHEDLDFGDTGYDGGVGAVVGVQGSSTAGLEWSCSAGLSDQSSAWFGLPSARVGSETVKLGKSEVYAYGSNDYAYVGETLAGGDLNGDGQDELLIGAAQEDSVYLLYGGSSLGVRSTDDAQVAISGTSGGTLGSAMALADLDGDGALDLALGEEKNDDAATDAGAVWLFENSTLAGTLTTSDADASLIGDSNSTKGKAGSGLAAPGDIDGDGYEDLVVGASGDDSGATNAGAAYIWTGGVLSGTTQLSGLASFTGSNSSDRLGEVLGGGDADGDGLADLLIGVQLNDEADTDAGKGYLVLGGSWSGSNDVDSSAEATFEGLAALDRLGGSVLLADLDGDGFGDLVFGAAREDSGGTNAGAVYVFEDGSSWSGSYDGNDADALIIGDANSQAVGTSLDAADMDGDGVEDLLIGGPGAYTSSGAAWVFMGLPSGSGDVGDADHTLVGVSGGSSGQAVVGLNDHDGSGDGDVAVGAWFASALGGTNNGFVAIWSYTVSFEDRDGDGLIARAAQGPDCDDDDASAYPGAEEDTGLDTGGYANDQDCDGWVDGLIQIRLNEDHWDYDLDQELGGPTPESFDFESGTSGNSVSSLYSSNGVDFTASNTLTAASSVYGSAPNGTLGARLSGSALLITFDSDVDAVAFQLLDASTAISVQVYEADGTELLDSGGKLRIEHLGDDVPGGRFVGFTFEESIRYLRIAVPSSDGIGLDDLQVSWTEDSDRDGDGYSGADGDCDDEDEDVHPGATEDLSDGIDNDCDGVIDGGGATEHSTQAAWEGDISIDVQVIDFEDLSSGDTVKDQYDNSGLTVDSTLEVTADIDGAGVNDTLGAENTSQTVTLSFEELQPAVAFELFDGQGTFTLLGYAGSSQLYGNTITVSENGNSSFHGYVYDYGVTTLVIQGPSSDTWGLDDIRLSELGLDDADGDGYTEADGDCDDDDSSVNPDATETWYDGVDQDCDGNSDYDSDGDGWDTGDDCDDDDSSVNPDATETWYDGVDQDCDGSSDYDSDGDGHDSEDYGGDDCDDDEGTVNPSAQEVYYDSVDDNCDPTDDYDADGDGYGTGSFSGSLGSGDCDDEEASTYPNAEETWYDGVDGDCSGGSDYDADGDGYESEAHEGEDCDDSDAGVNPAATDVWYDGVDQDCDDGSDYDADGDGYDHDGYGGDDCDDTDSSINPAATESDDEDGIDEDCDGTDEWDDDGDGYRGSEDGGTDCDDEDASIHPGATEICYDGTDQDCDGGSNEYDCDEDGYESDSYGGQDCDDSDGSIHPGAIEYVYDGIDSDCDGTDDYDLDGDGYQVDFYGGTDCDDRDITIHPGATEIWYDGVDQNCDTASDYDADGDGHEHEDYAGDDCDDTDSSIPGTEIPYDGIDQDCDGQDSQDADGDGHAASDEGGDDCDDADGSIFPGAPETWYDGIDQDCDESNEYDADGDKHDHEAYGGDDCDDENDQAYLNASERWYDGEDWDCLGGDDFDQDGDTWQVELWGGEDCKDTNPTINPGVELDLCGSGDEDCDEQVDEDCTDTGLETDDTGPDDTGSDDTGSDDTATVVDDTHSSTSDTDDHGEYPDAEGNESDKDGTCAGCSGGPSAPHILALILALMLRRRRLATFGG